SGSPAAPGGQPAGEPRPGPPGLGGGAPPARRAGTRDWVIAVECRADAFVLYPGGTRIPAAALATAPSSDNALSTAVRKEIARREALGRAGDAAYRAHVRFLVRPDGARGYYRAFPLLEALGVPMTRQNLGADEEIGLEHLTR